MTIEIHATVGPATPGATEISLMIAAGVDVIRVNLSHTRPADLPDIVARIREASVEAGRSVRISADVRGRKLRIGPLVDKRALLIAGQHYELISGPEEVDEAGNEQHAWVNNPDLASIVSPGTMILLDDGAFCLRVESTSGEVMRCLIETGGLLPERSGVNLPGCRMDLPALTGKDFADLDALAPLDIDGLYLSYVESAQDIDQLRTACAARGRLAALPIMAKIERAVALDHISSIAGVADSICLARGDLGVEIPMAEVPFVQREVVQQTREAGKPFVLAGEVLYSLVTRHVPTRAELTDVAVAVEQGVDGFILSDETAIGIAPVEAVRTLAGLVDSMQRRLRG